jgi:hypothetical protein
MEILNKTSKEKPRNLWKNADWNKYQVNVISLYNLNIII